MLQPFSKQVRRDGGDDAGAVRARKGEDVSFRGHDDFPIVGDATKVDGGSAWRSIATFFHLQAEFGGALRKPVPEIGGKAAKQRDFVAGRLIQLPEDHAQVRAGRHRRVAGAERSWDAGRWRAPSRRWRALWGQRAEEPHNRRTDRQSRPYRQPHAGVRRSAVRHPREVPAKCEGRCPPRQGAPSRTISALPEARGRRQAATFP